MSDVPVLDIYAADPATESKRYAAAVEVWHQQRIKSLDVVLPSHPMLTHPNGERCIWLDGEWFVPLDAGGEGFVCPQWHPGG